MLKEGDVYKEKQVKIFPLFLPTFSPFSELFI